ncbi:MAG: DnaD domain protein [Clostridia bacterium]|nr:DnaD domain protein [Clostridia bacterium]
MSYTVDPRAWGTVFPVPSDVVDKYIKLAGATQLRVLLWLLRNVSRSPDADTISAGLKIDKAEVEDALQFWMEVGIVMSDSVSQTVSEQSSAKQKPEPVKSSPLPAKKNIAYIKPNLQQIIDRTNEDENVKHLFDGAQSILSKTIGHDGQSTLLMLHDSFGLPVEVIHLLLSYCVSIGKASFVYISKVGRDWGEREIDTLEKADDQINKLKSCNKLWSELRQLAGIATPQPTNTQLKYLDCWQNELQYGVEMIFLAYEEMANNCAKISFPYMDKVLKSWNKDGLKTPDDVEKAKSERKSAGTSNHQKPNLTTSYDKDEFLKRALNDPLIYKRKEEEED